MSGGCIGNYEYIQVASFLHELQAKLEEQDSHGNLRYHFDFAITSKMKTDMDLIRLAAERMQAIDYWFDGDIDDKEYLNPSSD